MNFVFLNANRVGHSWLDWIDDDSSILMTTIELMTMMELVPMIELMTLIELMTTSEMMTT